MCGENSEPCVIWTITNLFNNNYSSKISLASYFIIYILLFIYYFILSINVLLICLDYTQGCLEAQFICIFMIIIICHFAFTV